MDNSLEILKKMVDNMIEVEYDNQLLKNVMLGIIGGLAYINLDGKYMFANKYYCDVFGYTEEELLNTSSLKMIHEDDIPILTKAYWDMVDNGKSESEFRGIKKDGSIFMKHCIMVKRFNSKGEFIGCYSFMRALDK